MIFLAYFDDVYYCVYIYIHSKYYSQVPNEFLIWMNSYELTRISWYGIQCFVSWLKSRLQHPLGHQLLVPSRVDSTNAAEGAIPAGWSPNPSGCGLLHDVSKSSWGSSASGSWAGVFWNRQKQSDIIIHRFFLKIFWSFPNRPFSIFSVIFQENIELRQVIVDECGTSPEPEVCQAIFRNLTRVSGIICWYLLYLERWGGFLYCRFSIKVQNKTFQSCYCN